MSILDQAILALEHESHTLSSAIYVVRCLQAQFAPPTGVEAITEGSAAQQMRLTVAASIDRRLGNMMASKGPAAMASAMDPLYGAAFLLETFSFEYVRETLEGLCRWIDDTIEDEVEPSSIVDDENELMPGFAAPPSRSTVLKTVLNQFVQWTRSDECKLKFPRPSTNATLLVTHGR